MKIKFYIKRTEGEDYCYFLQCKDDSEGWTEKIEEATRFNYSVAKVLVKALNRVNLLHSKLYGTYKDKFFVCASYEEKIDD